MKVCAMTVSKTAMKPVELVLPALRLITYFNVSYNGNDYNYESSLFQIGNNAPEEFGGWLNEGGSLFGGALCLLIYFADSAQNINVENTLEGNRIYFSDFQGGPFPAAEIKHLTVSRTQYSDYNINTNNYYLDSTEVNFLRNENDLFDIDVYAVKGAIEDGLGGFKDATGDFFLQCSHGNY
ncbi:MAG: hypothetical protein ACI9O4_000030 [Chitinophagales bacterium]|jgi:hypothetical protein